MLHDCRVLKRSRLGECQPALDGTQFDRARLRMQTATRRPVGLRQDEGNLEPGINERIERDRGKGWGAREYQSHGRRQSLNRAAGRSPFT